MKDSISNIDVTKQKKKSKKRNNAHFLFGNELFTRTQMRIKQRKKYNKSLKERMKSKDQTSNRKLRMDYNKTNPFRCTKLSKKNK